MRVLALISLFALVAVASADVCVIGPDDLFCPAGFVTLSATPSGLPDGYTYCQPCTTNTYTSNLCDPSTLGQLGCPALLAPCAQCPGNMTAPAAVAGTEIAIAGTSVTFCSSVASPNVACGCPAGYEVPNQAAVLAVLALPPASPKPGCNSGIPGVSAYGNAFDCASQRFGFVDELSDAGLLNCVPCPRGFTSKPFNSPRNINDPSLQGCYPMGVPPTNTCSQNAESYQGSACDSFHQEASGNAISVSFPSGLNCNF